jgi:hypothetical protein
MVSMSNAGKGTKPNTEMNGRYGNTRAIPIKINVLTSKSLPGRLRKKRWRVHTTRAMTNSVIKDSMNQPVRNSSGEARNRNSNVPKVRKSKTELTRPKSTIRIYTSGMGKV